MKMAVLNAQMCTLLIPSSPFSQWYKCKFIVDGKLYNCAAQYVLHQKAVLFGDNEIGEKIMKSSSQEEQQFLVQKVSNFNTDTWNQKSRNIVYNGNLAKFSQNEDIRKELIGTVGIVQAEEIPLTEAKQTGQEEITQLEPNQLGSILTDVRDAILRGELYCGGTNSETQNLGGGQTDSKTVEESLASSPQSGAADRMLGPEKYTFFWRSESPFSQWYKCRFSVAGIVYNCAEQYMMEQKAVLFGDQDIAAQIMKADSQKKQKSLGRKVSNFDDKVWNDNCKNIVYRGNLAKFSQNKDLKEILLSTKGTVLAEASPVDSIWGIGYAEDHPNARHRKTWRGKNRLGFILTDVREAIMRGEEIPNDERSGARNSVQDGKAFKTQGPESSRWTKHPDTQNRNKGTDEDWPKMKRAEIERPSVQETKSENAKKVVGEATTLTNQQSTGLTSKSGDESLTNIGKDLLIDKSQANEDKQRSVSGNKESEKSELHNSVENKRAKTSQAVDLDTKATKSPETTEKEQPADSSPTKQRRNSLEDIPWLVVKSKQKKKKHGKKK